MSCILCLGVWCDPWLLRKGPTYFSPWAASWKTSLVVSNASHSKLFRATLVTAVFLLTSAFSNIFFLIENSTRCFRQMTLKSPRLSRLLLSTGQRADVLRAGLKGLIDGSLQVVPPIIGMIYGQAVFFFFPNLRFSVSPRCLRLDCWLTNTGAWGSLRRRRSWPRKQPSRLKKATFSWTGSQYHSYTLLQMTASLNWSHSRKWQFKVSLDMCAKVCFSQKSSFSLFAVNSSVSKNHCFWWKKRLDHLDLPLLLFFVLEGLQLPLAEVEASSLFIAFAPEMQHVDRGNSCFFGGPNRIFLGVEFSKTFFFKGSWPLTSALETMESGKMCEEACFVSWFCKYGPG